MLIKQFSKLNDIDQEREIWNHGVLLANLDNGLWTRDIYQLFNFYASITFDLKNDHTPAIKSNINQSDV
jgi:hypothetical protein